jgi:hypothetical protein
LDFHIILSMIKRCVKSFSLLFFVYGFSFGQADRLNLELEPEGGVNRLAIVYYKIRFTGEQRARLQNRELEFIYTVNPQGNADLEDVKGIADRDILDSLYNRNPYLPQFIFPQGLSSQRNSIYFMKLSYPDYSFTRFVRYKRLRLNDFESIETKGRWDMIFGGMVNQFAGSSSEYLSTGGGMKIGFSYAGEKGYGANLNMSFYGNELKKDYPLTTTRAQNRTPPTLLIGIGLQKSFEQKEKSGWELQLELSYAIQNVTPRLTNNDNDWVQFKGFSPGIVINYFKQLGNKKVSDYYGNPVLISHNLNFHAGPRVLVYNFKEANGVMLEIGISYRMGIHPIHSYRLKESSFYQD